MNHQDRTFPLLLALAFLAVAVIAFAAATVAGPGAVGYTLAGVVGLAGVVATFAAYDALRIGGAR